MSASNAPAHAAATAAPATAAPAFAAPAATARWHRICALADIVPDCGAAALLDGRQIAIFRVRDALYVIGNRDPASGANVLARGIVGDLGGEPVVASPIYKQHFSLVSGRCLEEPELAVPAYLARTNAGQIWVRREPLAPQRTAAKRRLVVIGNGLAAARTLEELLALAPQAYEITVFGIEPQAGYDRVQLSGLLAGDARLEQIVTHPPEWYAQRGILLHEDDPIVQIDRVRRRVRSSRGIEIQYDRLLIATGSLPVELPVPGANLPGVVSFCDLRDAGRMLEAARAHRCAVVIGGGLLGLEAADGLRRQGMQVTVVHAAPHLLNGRLDAPAAQLLRAELESRGIALRMPADVTALAGEQRVTAVRLADGTELPADLVVVAVGGRPNIALAQAAGLRCSRGILVDDTLLSFDPAVYAVGECIQHRYSTHRLVTPPWDQARVCAAHLAERGIRRYRASPLSSQLKIGGIDVFSAGDCTEATSGASTTGGSPVESLVLRDPGRGVYKRLMIENNRIRGAVLYGDTRDGSWYFDLIKAGRDIGALRDQLLFGAPPLDPHAAGGAAGSGGKDAAAAADSAGAAGSAALQ
ncbi:MAG TPA: nitrite reductase small subunit NirD [Steroidobacteraceae bacterium]|jgi:nitrite reductase (NADH) large subunit|nr:nitrite reductase small subunit NirD [Steroidobacteraceae bacterium]